MMSALRRPRSLRAHLLSLVTLAVFPLIGFAAVLIATLLHQQRVAAEHALVEITRALAIATDSRIHAEIERLEVLATSPALSAGDLRAFYEEATRSAPVGGLESIALIDRSGQPLLNLRWPFGSGGLPNVSDRQYFRDVLATGRPAVSDVVSERTVGHPVIIVGVPVSVHGELHYVLTSTPPIQTLLEILAQERIPPHWIATIMDRTGVSIARTVDPVTAIGHPASTTFRARATQTPEGTITTRNKAGEVVYDGFSHTGSGWIVSITVPASVVEAPYRRTLWETGMGSLVFIVGGTGLALGWSRGIARPLRRLSRAAEAVGRGGHVVFEPSNIPEIDAVAQALVAASEERDRSEAQRKALLAREQGARAEAEAANRTKDQFLAVLSHELRTPINAVYGWARMLQGGQLEAGDAPRALDAIVRNSNAQVQLIDDLLDVSRVITGKMRLDVGMVDLRTVIEGALDTVRPAAAAKGLRLENVLDARVGSVTGDPRRLQQVMWNLLMNAVKFTPKGGHVQVHLHQMSSYVEIVVRDTGQGIEPQILPFIFERFTQADSSSTRPHSGLGLGLALVKHLVELHGGSVAAESAGEGKGATFIVRLPLVPVEVLGTEDPGVHTAVTPAPSPSAVDLDGVRVLVVDDDTEALDLASAILGSAGAAVRSCLSARDALEVLRLWHPDVLVSDIEMPAEDGYSLIRKVRALDGKAGGRIPAVAVTGYGRQEDRVRSLSAGFNMHVPKPVDPGELTTIIASVVGRTLQARHGSAE